MTDSFLTTATTKIHCMLHLCVYDNNFPSARRKFQIMLPWPHAAAYFWLSHLFSKVVISHQLNYQQFYALAFFRSSMPEGISSRVNQKLPNKSTYRQFSQSLSKQVKKKTTKKRPTKLKFKKCKLANF